MKTHLELCISESEFASMIQVRDLFASGAIEHSPSNFELPRGSVFYMGYSCFRSSDEETACGALMCIGGWIKAFDLGIVDVDDPYETMVTAAHEQAISAFVCEAEGGLQDFLRPDVPWAGITPAAVALAIDAFLETGLVDWKAIVAQARIIDVSEGAVQ